MFSADVRHDVEYLVGSIREASSDFCNYTCLARTWECHDRDAARFGCDLVRTCITLGV